MLRIKLDMLEELVLVIKLEMLEELVLIFLVLIYKVNFFHLIYY